MRISARTTLAAGAAVLAIGIGLAAWHWPDSRYYGASEVEHAAHPLRRIDIEPAGADAGIEYFGVVRMDLYIGRDRVVERVEVPHSTVLPAVRDRVVRAFTSARWQPARMRDGREVRSVKRVQVDFEPPAGARAPMRPDS
jgi:hypothetical protein